jgi:succinyl-CoA synthetase beta subunit
LKLYEYESKLIFKQFNINVPDQIATIRSSGELDDLNINYPVMVKAMVLIGGRGKAGGIKKASTLEEAKLKADEIFKLTIKGLPVKQILIEEAVDIISEIYLSVTTDPATFDVILVTSASGGIDIEDIAKNNPEAIFKSKILENPMELPSNVAIAATTFLINQNSNLEEVETELQDLISSVFKSFQEIDAKLYEINPVILTTLANKKILLAADAKIILDDNALYRQASLLRSIGIDPQSKRHDVAEQTIFEGRAYKAGFPYIDLLDEGVEKEADKLYVGIVPGGAGYGIFSIDEVVNVGDRYFDGRVIPINFMDSGGGPSLATVAEMFHILMDNPLADMIITSRFGGISSCDIFIQGLIMALRDRYLAKKRMLPVYGRMVGTDLSAAAAFLQKAKEETPEPLKNLHIIVGNQKIMADIIKDGLEYGFTFKGGIKQ